MKIMKYHSLKLFHILYWRSFAEHSSISAPQWSHHKISHGSILNKSAGGSWIIAGSCAFVAVFAAKRYRSYGRCCKWFPIGVESSVTSWEGAL